MTISSILEPVRSTRSPARLATRATAAASEISAREVTNARANRPFVALLKWLTTLRSPAVFSVTTRTVMASGIGANAA